VIFIKQVNEKVNKKNNDWLELCEYVKDKILRYNNDMKFPQYLALRLKGLQNGNFIANNKSKPMANYDFKTILLTFKYCSTDIKNYIDNNKDRIKDEQHLINLIMMFIEKNINDIVKKIQEKNKTQEKLNLLDNSILQKKSAKYISKTKFEKDKENEDLW
jgi:hypothetical protein